MTTDQTVREGQAHEHRPCEHYWVSHHQPDFPPPIYWVRVCGLCGEIDGADLARELAPPIEVDEWCREPDCRWRHWRSGDMPTHKRGGDCPEVTL